MAGVLEGHVNYGIHSLVNRPRPALPLGMPKRSSIIEISDDEDEVVFIDAPTNMAKIPEAEFSTRTRYNLSSSPMVQRDPKRLRLAQQPSVDDSAATVKSEFPKLKLNFETDSDGHSQLLPSFFNDAFVTEPPSDNDEVQVFEIPTLKEPEPPYFDDPKLQIRMYRGPGFEHFPIPLNESHKDFCDKWDAKKLLRDAKRTRYNEFGPYIDPTVMAIDDDEEIPQAALSDSQKECLAKVVEVLTEVDPDFVVEKIRSHQESINFADEEIELLPEPGTIISEILEMNEYPRRVSQTDQVKIPYEIETGRTIVWEKAHREDKNYLSDSVILMTSQFEYVPSHHLHKIVHEKKTLWDAFVHIDDADRNYFLRNDALYKRLRRPRLELEKKYQRINPNREPEYYASLITELQAAKQHCARQMLQKEEEKRKANAEVFNLAKHKADGLLVTCGCCFDEEVPLNRAVTCTGPPEEHSFCFGCVENLADSQIGLSRHEMICMDTNDDCKHKLDVDGVGRAIPYRTFNKLLLNEQQAEIAAANLEGLEQCPFCEFKAICDPVEVDTVFSCQNRDCFKVSCRKCHEISHLPKTCEDMKKDRGLNARHKIEEARSAAMMRPCPTCKKNLIKEMGCNKLRCTCGGIMCYVCKADLSKMRDGYSHFNGGSTLGKKCPLYDVHGVDRHEEEANNAEIEAIKAAKEADNTIEEKALQVETGKTVPASTTNLAEALRPGAPRGRGAIEDRLERDARRREEARARRRARIMPARDMNMPPIQPPPPGYPVLPGHRIAAHRVVRPIDPDIGWREGMVDWDEADLALDDLYGRIPPEIHPIRDILNHDSMDLDVNYAPGAHGRRQARGLAANPRNNDLLDENIRRRMLRGRNDANRDAVFQQDILQLPQAQVNQQPQFGVPQVREPMDYRQYGQRMDELVRLTQQVNAETLIRAQTLRAQTLQVEQRLQQQQQQRAQYHPTTPVLNPRDPAPTTLLDRGNPLRRGTVPIVNPPATVNQQAGIWTANGQGQVQNPLHNNQYGGNYI